MRAAEAIRAVKRLQHACAHYLEFGLWADLADLFAEHSVIELPAGKLSGRESIARHLMSAAGRNAPGLAQGQLNSHLVMQPIVTLGADGVSAKATWHEMAMLGRLGAFAEWRGGIYENDYALEDGIWKISALRFFEQYRGAFDDWGHKARATWNIPYHFDAESVGVTIPQAAIASLARACPASTAQDIALRIERLNDETAIANLQHSFGYYLDRKLWDQIADLFAADGTLDLGYGIFHEPERIRGALEAHYGQGLRHGELFDHIILATISTVAPDGLHGAARSFELGMIGQNGERAEWTLGIYENKFVKESGTWKLQAVRYHPRMRTNYDLGWARDAGPVSEMPGFHLNPVTGGAAASLSDASAAPQNMPASLQDLQRKLDATIAVDAAENLNSSYGYYLDESAWDSMADTFAATGEKEITGAGVYIGPERIRHILNLRGPRGGRNPNFYTIHQLVQPVIHISPDGSLAEIRSRLFQCGGNADGSSGSWIGGIYENTAVKQDGAWKFSVQDLHHLFYASYRNGWARMNAEAFARFEARGDKSARNQRGGGITQGLGGARSPTNFAAEFPPDRTIRAKQYAFPEITEPAFHYVNPVSGRAPPALLPPRYDKRR